MNDTDIKDVLHDRAVSVAPPTEVPATLKRRMRRRQGANLLGVAALVAIIAVGGFGAWRTVSPLGRGDTQPIGPGPSAASLSALPIGDATVVASGDSAGGPWALTAKETDSGDLSFSFVTLSPACCAGWSKAAPSGPGSVWAGAASSVSGTDPSSGAAFLFGEASSDIGRITARLADGSSFDAVLYPIPVGGPEWSQAQVYLVVIPGHAYAHVSVYSFRDDGTPVDDGRPLDITVGGQWIAVGDSAFGPWRLTNPIPVTGEAPLTNPTLRLFLAGNWYEVGRPLKDPGEGLLNPQALVLAHITGADKDGSYQVGTLVFGSVGSDVASVELRGDDPGTSTVWANIGDLVGIQGGWRGFGLVTESDSGVIIARDASGNVLEEYALDPFVNSNDPANFLLVVAEGTQGGTSWRLVATGQLPVCIGTEIFTASSGSMGGGCGSAGTPDGLAFATSPTSDRQPGLTLVYGSVPTDAASVDVTAADGSVTNATLVRCPCGSLDAGANIFYAELPPNTAVDSVTARAADGTVVEPTPLPSPPDRMAVPSPQP